MAKPRTLKALRQNLIVSTALIGGVVGMSAVAQAQVLPDPTGATITTGGTSGGAPGANNPLFSVGPNANGYQTETVSLRDNRTIINWSNNFVVSGGYGIDFKDGRAAVAGLTGLTDNIAVLNRDLSGIKSGIYGSLTSDANVAVYLINANGVLVSNAGSVNVGSFFASTSNITNDGDFLAGNALRFGVAGTGSIDLQGPASITTTANGSINGGRLGDLVLLGAAINVGPQATVTATGGDVAFVAADDVTIATGAGSPLSLLIHKGTAVPGAFNVSGTVAGRNVTMALATRGNVADAVLNVGGMVTATGAALTDRGIVLTAGASGDGAALGAVPSGAPGADISYAGSVAVTAVLDSRRAIGINALQGASVSVGATADGAISVATDGAIGLAALTAGGPISVSGNGAKTFSGTLKTTSAGAAGLVSVDGGGASTFVATQSIDSAGSVALGQASPLGSLSAKQIKAAGDFNGYIFGQTDIVDLAAGGLAKLESVIGGFNLGAVKTGGHFDVTAINGLVQVGGQVDVGGNYTVNAGALTLGAVGTTLTQAAKGSVTLSTGASGIDALGMVTLRSNADGNGADALTLASAGPIGFGNVTLLAGTALDKSDLRIRSASASSAITLGAVDARALLGAVGAAPFSNGLASAAPLVLGAVTLTDTLALQGSSVTTGTIKTGGDVTLVANGLGSIGTGTIDATGMLTANAGGAVTIGASGGAIKASAIDVTGGSITTEGSITTAALTLHATGALAVNGPSTVADTTVFTADGGTATILGNVSANGAYTVTGAGVVLGATGSTVLQQARDGITIHATGAPGIAGLGTLTLLSNNLQSFDPGPLGITLRTDAGGIAFGPTSSLRGGAGMQSNVTIDATPAAAAIALGTVSARALTGLNARQGAVTLGDVTVATGLDVRTTSGAIETGTIGAYGDVSLITDAGTLSSGAITSDQGMVTGRSTDALTTGTVRGLMGADLQANGTVGVGDVVTSGPVTLRSVASTVTAGAVSGSVVTVSGDLGVTLGSVGTTPGAVTLTATQGAIQVTGDVEAGAILTATARDAVTAANLRGASLVISGSSVRAGEARAYAGGVDILATAGNIQLETATAPGSNLVLTAMGTGSVLLGSGTAASAVLVMAGGDIRVDSLRASSGDLTMTAGGSITGRALGVPAADGRFDAAFGRSDLTSTGNVVIMAGMGDTLAQLGDVVHGGGNTSTVAAGAVDVRGLGIDFATATAREGALSLIATNTGFSLGTGSAGTTVRLQQAGSGSDLVAATVIAGTKSGSTGDVTIVSNTNTRLGSVTTATGGIDITAGITLSGLASGPGYGRAILSGLGRIAVQAQSVIALGALSGGDICLNGNAGCTDPQLSSTFVDVDGPVTATGKFFAGGSNITLGSSGTSQTMRANGSVRLVTTSGSINGGSGLTLIADGDNSGGDTMTLDAGGAGGILFAAGSTLYGGSTIAGLPTRSADIGIRLGNPGAPLQLGAVSARSFGGVDAAGSIFGALSTTGPVTLGAVSVRNELSITTTQGITTGAVSVTDTVAGVGQGLRLDAGGNLTATGALSSQGNLFLGADGNLSFTTATSLGGTATLDVGGDAQGQLVSAAGTVLETVGGADTIVDTTTTVGDVTITADSVTKNSAVAAGALSITAQNGGLSLNIGSAGGTALLRKLGSVGALSAGTVTAGGTATIDSATDVRLGTVDARSTPQNPGGSVIVTSGASNEVTGLLLGAPAVDGRPAPAYGRANLLAANAVSVNGGTLAQFGLVTHGTLATDIAEVTADAVDVAADTVDLTTARARTGALALLATSGQLTLGTGNAGTTATITKQSTVPNDPTGLTIGSLRANGLVTISSSQTATLGTTTSVNSDIGVTAAGAVTASDFTAGGAVRVTSTGGDAAIADAVSAGGDYVVTARNVALGVDPGMETQSAGGRVAITATAGSIMGGVGLTLRSNVDANGLSVADSGNTRTLNLDATGNISFDLSSTLLGGTARDSIVGINLRSPGASLTLGTVTARALNAVNAGLNSYTTPLSTSGEIVLGDVSTTQALDVRTSAGSIRARSLESLAGGLTLQASGAVTGLAGASIGTIDTGFDRVQLAAGSDVSVIAGTQAQFGSATAGGTITVNAGTGIDVTTATATAGALSLTTLSGPLFLTTGTAGGTALLDKRGSDTGVNRGLRVNTLTATGTSTIKSSTDARIGTVTSTAGDIAVSAVADVTGLSGASDGIVPTFGRADLTALAAGRSITVGVPVGVGGLVQLGTVRAGQDVTVNAGMGIDITTATATAGALALTTLNGPLFLTTGTAGGSALLDKRGADTGLGGGVRVTALTAGGTATIKSSTDARIGAVTSTAGDIAVSATNDVTGLLGASDGIAPTFGRADLTALAAGRSVTVGVPVGVGGLVQLGTVRAGQDITVNAGTGIDITTATATAGALSLTTLNGPLFLTSGTAGSTALLDKRGTDTGVSRGLRVTTLTATGTATIKSSTDARIGTVTSTGGDISVVATAGSATGLAGAPAGAIDAAFGRANLFARAAGRDVTVTAGANAQLDMVRAGRTITVGAGAIDLVDAAATAGSLDLTSTTPTGSTGVLRLGTGSAGTTATLIKQGTANGEVIVTSLSAGTATGSIGNVTIQSATNARLGSVSSATGDVAVTATSGAVTGLSGASTGTTDTTFGRANLTAAAGRDATVMAGPLAQLGTVTAGRNVAITANAVDTGTATATAGSLAVTASTGALLLGTGTAGTSATLRKTGTTGDLVVSAAVRSGTTTTISSTTNATVERADAGSALDISATSTLPGSGNLTLRRGGGATTTTLAATGLATLGASGAVYAAAASGGVDGAAAAVAANTLTLAASDASLLGTVKGFDVTFTVRDPLPVGNAAAVANTLRLGDTPGGSAGFDLSATELNRLDATNLTFNTALGGTSRDVRLGSVALGATVGRTRLDVLSLGTITVSGAVSAPTAGRTLRLGGTNATDRAAAIQIVTTPTITGGGSIIADALDLRGTQIAGGQQALLTTLAAPGTSLTTLVSNPNSVLYNASVGGTAYTGSANAGTANTGTAPVFLSANTLSLSYGQYALFQNTGANGDTGGVNIGQLTGPSLTLTSSGATGQNAFALFGRIGVVGGPTAIGRATALLGPTSIDFTTSNNPRINPNNSRINGCLIGSGGGGCLITSIVLPRVSFFDLAQVSILTTANDLALAFDPLVGTSNEALFSDLGTIDLFSTEDVPCPPGSTSETCRKSGAPK